MSVTPRAPILIITTGRARFGDYLGEILRTEGLNVFEMRKLSSIDAALLRLYEVVILMEGALSDRQVDLFSTYVSDGGRLIGIKPDRGLAEVFGLQTAQGSTGEGYVRFNTSTPVGRGPSASGSTTGVCADTPQDCISNTGPRWTAATGAARSPSRAPC